MRARCTDHIFLIGFMGAGKTCVSRSLSAITGLSLVDVDQRIVALQHRSVPDIFAQDGEAAFRAIETDTLRRLVFEPRSIVSCGGGIVQTPANREVLAELGTTIYLQVELDEALSRISRPETRPMLSGPVPVSEIYEARIPLYEQCADITIRTGDNTPGHIARKCRDALVERGLV